MDKALKVSALKLLIEGMETMVAALELLQMHYETESEDRIIAENKEDTS